MDGVIYPGNQILPGVPEFIQWLHDEKKEYLGANGKLNVEYPNGVEVQKEKCEVSHLLGHAKEIISVDIYGDTQEIIEDCLDVLEPFIEEVIPKERKDQYYDYSDVIEIDLILEEYFNAA